MKAYNPYQRPRIVGMNEQGANTGTVSVDVVQAMLWIPIVAVALVYVLAIVVAAAVKYAYAINIAVQINIGYNINIAYNRSYTWGPPPKG